ncbi:MAG: hypothetical protein ACI4FX_03570 [Agathobacter sp.]
MKKKFRLTTRGKQTVIMVLTVLGCILGVVSATVISEICSEEEDYHAVMACEREMDDGETEGGEEIKTEIIESISPQWLFYQSHADTSEGTEEKEYLDRLVNSWTKGRISDNELSEQISDFFRKQKLSVSSVNVQSHMLCLFPSANEIPDYTGMLQKESGRYDFIGLYTDGQTDEEGRIMCYYWEAGVR